MNQHMNAWRDREIRRLEEQALRDEGYANALESDVRNVRLRAETARKTAEYLRKSVTLPGGRDDG